MAVCSQHTNAMHQWDEVVVGVRCGGGGGVWGGSSSVGGQQYAVR
jgi:hypothetical protein